MNQRLKQTRWQRWTNNVLSNKEALMWIVVLIGGGIVVGLVL